MADKARIGMMSDGQSVFWTCPGCKTEHRVLTAVWQFNGDLKKPTITPDVTWMENGNPQICHSQITDGKAYFYPDTTANDKQGKTMGL